MDPENKEASQVHATGTETNIGDSNFVKRNKDGNIDDFQALALMREGKNEPNNPDKQRGVWFSKSLIREIYSYISNPAFDGVRVYFAKYLRQGYEAVETRQGPQNYNGKHTVVIVPTKPAPGNTSEDDLPDDEDLQKLIEEFLEKGKRKAYNHGELCPPQTGCRS